MQAIFNHKAESKSESIAKKYDECTDSGTKFDQPDSFPLDYNLAFFPFPYKFQTVNFKERVDWTWLQFFVDRHFVLSGLILTTSSLSILLIILRYTVVNINRKATTAFSIIFGLLTPIFVWFRINMARNENYRRTLCFAYAKSVQAKKIWDDNKDPMYAKDIFYSGYTFRGEVNVLRDGTVEMVPPRLDELSRNGNQDIRVDSEGTGFEIGAGGKFGNTTAQIATSGDV